MTASPAPPTEAETTETAIEEEETGELDEQAEPPPLPRLRSIDELLGSDDWVGRLMFELINSESCILHSESVWARLRGGSSRERLRQTMGALLKDCASMPQNEISDLKRKILSAIRKIHEPYRSALVYHYCEGVSIADLIDHLGIPSWIVRERLAKALGLLDEKLDTELGKRKLRIYASLAQLAMNPA